MTTESAFIESLRALATDPAARGLIDDVAVVQVGGETLVLTHDMMVEGVHYLPDDPPEERVDRATEEREERNQPDESGHGCAFGYKPGSLYKKGRPGVKCPGPGGHSAR